MTSKDATGHNAESVESWLVSAGRFPGRNILRRCFGWAWVSKPSRISGPIWIERCAARHTS